MQKYAPYTVSALKKDSDLTVLVTGGSGFIGSHVVDKLIDSDITPRIFDMVPSPYHAAGSVETYIGDLSDRESIATAMQGCDAAIHLAAVADVNEVVLDPGFAGEVNATGTLNVLEAARESSLPRVVYASTIWAYQDCEEDFVDEETALKLPSHLYTATKVAGEMYCRSYSALYGLDCTVLRLGIPYGPRARPAAVVPQFVRKALDGEALTIAGRGDQSRRFVYVEDLAEGIVAGLRDVAKNRVFNLVGTEDTTILQIAEVVRDLVGDVEISHTEARAADFKGAEVCGRRAKEELDWQAKTSFATGVASYLEWYRESQHHRADTEEVVS
jgi:UDP-glucose 4-epimerase